MKERPLAKQQEHLVSATHNILHECLKNSLVFPLRTKPNLKKIFILLYQLIEIF